ncbi:g4349 [Coccomyxa elongata]
MTGKQGHHHPSAFSVPSIEEVDVERGPSGETDALIDKALLDGEQSIDGSLDSAGHLDGDDGKSRQRLVTTILINLSAIMERTDEQLLPAVYRFVGASFQASPSQLGYLTLSRAVVQALVSPIGGFLGHYYNRIWVITFGCLLWGIMTGAFASCHTVSQGYIFWGINGIGLSMVIPSGQSMVADYYPEERRGAAFGALYLTGAIGAMLGALYATNIGAFHPLGIEGWRFAFLSVGLLSASIGILTFLFGHDPRFEDDSAIARVDDDPNAEQPSFWALLEELGIVCMIPTFLIIVFQGIVGSAPWNAIVFLTLYLQLLGMGDGASSALMALFLGGSALGGLVGGFLGDKAARMSPYHGRIVVCQLSVFAGVPFSYILFKCLPMDGTSPLNVAIYAVLLFLMGLCIAAAAPACNNPVFAEIVPPELRNMIYAFDRSFEGAIAACGAPLVGILAERVFGFKGAAEIDPADVDQNLGKARALGNALLCCMAIPWALCVIIYSGLHYTYPRDKRRAHFLAQMEPLNPELERAVTMDLGYLDLGYVLLPRTRLKPPQPKRTASCPELCLLHSL